MLSGDMGLWMVRVVPVTDVPVVATMMVAVGSVGAAPLSPPPGMFTGTGEMQSDGSSLAPATGVARTALVGSVNGSSTGEMLDNRGVGWTMQSSSLLSVAE
jgi:hypothetical protein